MSLLPGFDLDNAIDSLQEMSGFPSIEPPSFPFPQEPPMEEEAEGGRGTGWEYAYNSSYAIIIAIGICALAIFYPPLVASITATPIALIDWPAGIAAVLATFIPLVLPEYWRFAAVPVSVIAFLLLAKGVNIKLDLPQVGKTLVSLVKSNMGGQGGAAMPGMGSKPSIRLQLRRSDDRQAPQFGGMPMMGQEEIVISADFIALLLTIIAPAISAWMPTASILIPSAIAVGLFLLQYQERQRAAWLFGLAGIFAAVGVLWLRIPFLAAIFPFFVPIKGEEPPVEALPEEDEWAESLRSRIAQMAVEQVGPMGSRIEVERARDGLQEVYSVKIDGVVAPPAFVQSLAAKFGDISVVCTRRNGVIGLLVTNPHIQPMEVTADEFLRARQQLSDNYLLLGLSSPDKKPVAVDLSEVPHIGVWGGSGSGKSVTVRSAVMGSMSCATPEELHVAITDPKAVTFPFKSSFIIINTASVLSITATYIALLSEAQRRMIAFRSAGCEKLSEYLQLYPGSLARVIVILEELETLAESSSAALVGGPKKAGALNALGLYTGEDSEGPYTPEERAEIEALIPRSFFAAKTLHDVITSSVTQLLATARATGIHLILSTQTPKAEVIPSTWRGNIGGHCCHRMPESVAGVLRAVLGSERPVMPWEIPQKAKGAFVFYSAIGHETGRGCYIQSADAAKIAEEVPPRKSLNLMLCQDASLWTPEAVARYRRLDEAMLRNQVAQGTVKEGQAAVYLEDWYDGLSIRALRDSKSPLPPGFLIDLALRVPASSV